MNKLLPLILLVVFATSAKAQTSAVPGTQAFGKIDKADLELKACDFEKDANAEVLFDKGTVNFDPDYKLVFDRHKRIKIFNDNGKNEANIRILYLSFLRAENITDLEAETINLEKGEIVHVKIDKKQIFTQNLTRGLSALVFSFPAVKAGSVIEFKYRLVTASVNNFPIWYFQGSQPTRYSEFTTNIPDKLLYKTLAQIHYPLVIDKTSGSDPHSSIRALANIPSLKYEPYMGTADDNSERIFHQLLSVYGSYTFGFSNTWAKIREEVLRSDYLGRQLKDRRLSGEDAIIAKAKNYNTADERIAYIFNEVKNTMKWNDVYDNNIYQGVDNAWEKKTGNSTDVNLVLYHLLKKAGLNVYLMAVSTRKNGHITPGYPNFYQFNSTAVYIPMDDGFYTLDATNKYNIYNQVPDNLLNSFGFLINNPDRGHDLVFMENPDPVRQIVLINAEIKPDSKMTGTADISSFAYNRIGAVKAYKTDGEKKYIENLRNNNNNLKISSVNFENMDTDTLPLRQSINFSLDLTGSDDNYIYFNTNLFSNLNSNPFLSEQRATDIDFGYRNNYTITGVFKIPTGYKIDASPKSQGMTMPDSTISFKRIVVEEDGSLMVRITIDHKKSIYFKQDYPEFYVFWKKMFEMLNEQIVLKKA